MLSSGEVRFTLEGACDVDLSTAGLFLKRLFSPAYTGIIGARLSLKREGLVVTKVTDAGPFSRARIEPGDRIYRIGSRNVRYMPMKKIEQELEEKQGQEIEIVIRRKISLWKKDARQ